MVEYVRYAGAKERAVAGRRADASRREPIDRGRADMAVVAVGVDGRSWRW